jgi:hypothetical protein
VDMDCAASGMVTSRFELLTVIDCRAERERSAEVAALPVEVVMPPLIGPCIAKRIGACLLLQSERLYSERGRTRRWRK